MQTPSLWQVLWQALQDGETMAIATVVRSEGSTPRPAGASLLLRPHGAVVGAVSGGCVEADLLEAAAEVIASGRAQQRRYAAADSEDPFSIGLTCGGSLEVVIEPIDPGAAAPVLAALAAAIQADQPALLVSRAAGPQAWRLLSAQGATGSLGQPDLDAAADAAWLQIGADQTTTAGAEWPSRAWIDEHGLVMRLHQPRPPFWIIGAIDGAAALAQLARQLGFRVTVVDARATFATAERFPMADAVVCEWPDSWMAEQGIGNTTVIAVLTHDPKFDIPVLSIALRSPAAYVGAMGSRRTNEDRLQRLRQAGLGEAELRRLRAPIGLDLGGRSAEAMAVAIVAEIVMLRHGGTGLPLCERSGPIHPDAALSPSRPCSSSSA